MKKYILITETGNIEDVQIGDYRDMQKAVRGLITIPWEGEKLEGRATVIANDEAILKGMVYNAPASHLLGHPIYGPLLVGGATDDEGNIGEVTGDVYDTIMQDFNTATREARSLRL